jgi:hypothetical protein
VLSPLLARLEEQRLAQSEPLEAVRLLLWLLWLLSLPWYLEQLELYLPKSRAQAQELFQLELELFQSGLRKQVERRQVALVQAQREQVLAQSEQELALQ